MEPPLLRELLLTLHVYKERITLSPINHYTLETFAHLTTSATETPVAMEASVKLTSTEDPHAKDRETELVLLDFSATHKEIATTLFLLEQCALQATPLLNVDSYLNAFKTCLLEITAAKHSIQFQTEPKSLFQLKPDSA